jgi:hypothetical protein
MPTKEWYDKHKNDPEFKAKRKEESERYWEKHKDKQNEKRRVRRKEDEAYRASQNERSQKWAEQTYSDPEARAEKNRKQREWYKNSDEAQAKAREYRRQYKLPASTKEKKKAWVIQRRANHMAKLVELLGGECRICSLRDDPIVYDFHHVDPELKKFEISKWIASTSWDKIWKEAQKCVLLCSICHRKLTHGKIKQPNWAFSCEEQDQSST